METKYLEVRSQIEKIEGLLKVDWPTVKDQCRRNLHRAAFRAEIHGSSVMVRFLLRETKSDLIKFWNEVNVLTSLRKQGLDYQPEVIAYSEKDRWIAETFIKGEPAGRSMFYGREFIDSVKPLELIGAVLKMQSVLPKLRQGLVRVQDFYLERYRRFSQYWPQENIDLLESWKIFFDQHVRQIISNPVLCHGDMNPGNIIFNKEGFAGLIDWEQCLYDGRYRDLAIGYVSALKYPEWQREYHEHLNLVGEEENLFNFYVFYYYADNYTNLLQLLAEGKNEIFRSGKFSSGEAKDFSNLTFAALRDVWIN